MQRRGASPGQKLAAKPLSSLIETKRLMKKHQLPQIAAVMAEEGASFGRMLREPAAREAFGAFMEKTSQISAKSEVRCWAPATKSGQDLSHQGGSVSASRLQQSLKSGAGSQYALRSGAVDCFKDILISARSEVCCWMSVI